MLELVSEMVMNAEQMLVVVPVDGHFFVCKCIYKRESVCVCARCVVCVMSCVCLVR